MVEDKFTPKIPGLSSAEAAKKLAEYGENEIYRKKRLRPVVVFLKKFNSPLLLLLISASLISFFLGQQTSAAIILSMVFLSGVLDFANTYKSQKAEEKLISRVASTASVFRDGVRKEVPFRFIVPGDVVFLSAGDVVPADGVVLEADDFFVNQSSVTGESFPVEKRPIVGQGAGYKDSEWALLNFRNKSFQPGDETAVFMGTSAVTGFATALVFKTGRDTEFGKIAESLASPERETDFEKGIKNFSFFIMRLAFVLVAFVFLANALVGRNILESLIFAVAIAVGLTPELMPVIMSVSLSRGSLVMAKKDVVVKNLASIQNFGAMTILCTDKTGTLTEDKITLMKCLDFSGQESEKVHLFAYLNSIFHTAAKGPLDSAIQERRKFDIVSYDKIDEIPFDFIRKRDSIVVEKNGLRIMISKGAPEGILEICNFYREKERNISFQTAARKIALANFDKLSADGFRVLSVAMKELDKGEEKNTYSKNDERGMVFLGFAAFLDPPKKTVIEAIRELHYLNVVVKIITGDSEILTQRICRDIGLEVKGAVTGVMTDNFSDDELRRVSKETTIFARINPEQKERIITALRETGEVVGYLGDGINDAPALKAADVGISVANAVDVAKETADIILLKKSLHVLKDGIIEGRKTFQNTFKYIKMNLSSNFGNMFSMVAASAFLPFLPMLPAQILFNNFLYDVSQMALPSDSADEEDIRKPLHFDLSYLRKYMAVFGITSSVFDFFTFFMLFSLFGLAESRFQTGWFLESIATQVFVVYVIRTRKLPFFQSRPSPVLFFSTVLVVMIAWFAAFSSIGGIFGFSVLPLNVSLAIAGVVAVYLVVAEGVKRVFNS